MDRVTTIRQMLTDELSALHIDIEDDSHKHVGHPGAAAGGGHFNVTVVSDQFDGKSIIARHRLVYAALEPLMPAEIHALSIRALTPEEHQSAKV